MMEAYVKNNLEYISSTQIEMTEESIDDQKTADNAEKNSNIG